MKNKYMFAFYFVLIVSCRSRPEVMFYAAPTLTNGTSHEMNSPGFWISRTENPDSIILTDNEIKKLNQKTAYDFSMIYSILDRNIDIDISSFKQSAMNSLKFIKYTKLYDTNGNPISQNFIESIEDSIENFDDFPIEEFGVLIVNSDIRIIPYEFQITDVKMEMFFDAIQASSFPIGTAVKIIQYSKNKDWAYVLTENVAGWVKVQSLAICSKMEVEDLFSNQLYVVTDYKADIYSTPAKEAHISYIRMGSYLYAKSDQPSNDFIIVKIPVRTEIGKLKFIEGYIRTDSVNKGFLKYTKAAVLTQAFKMLHAPYGWGGMFGEQDCSQFLYEIYHCFGINMPRNSTYQSLVGLQVTKFNKLLPNDEKEEKIILEGIPGVTLLRRPGHIVMYIGTVNNKAYCIHAVWGYKTSIDGRDVQIAINQVAVTDLYMGEDSKKGSMLNHLNRMNHIQ